MITNNISSAGEPNLHPRILVVDDDPLIRLINTEVLAGSGYQVDAEEDGAAAWDALQLIGYDLLVTDNDMPKLSGVGLLQKLHAAHMAMPVIMATGNFPHEELGRHPWLQIDATLLKPYTFDDLLETVKNVLHAINDVPAAITAPSYLPAIAQQPDSIQRILVVDDDSDTRQLSVDVLANSGYDVHGVKDGAAGWEALQTYDYDLVVTDNKMPRMTGIEMIEKLRSARIAVPVIMATGNLPTNEFVRRPWLKPDAALERPFSNDDLLAAVRKVLHTDDGSSSHKETLLSKYL